MDSDSAKFDWSHIVQLNAALDDLRIDSSLRAPKQNRHCLYLRDAGAELAAGSIAISNATELAEAHTDLVVLLLEPANQEATSAHSQSMPDTITYVDNEFHNASHSRNWKNTCIFDIRPFRSQARRKYEDPEEQKERDDIAYEATKQMLDMLEPDVVLLCQSATRSSKNGFAKMVSSTAEHGMLSLYKLQSGKRSILVHGFHPM